MNNAEKNFYISNSITGENKFNLILYPIVYHILSNLGNFHKSRNGAWYMENMFYLIHFMLCLPFISISGP